MTLSLVDFNHQSDTARMRNLSVIACNETDGFYYPGFISKFDAEEETVLVLFYDIKPSRVVREDVIYTGGAVPCPDLQVGDYALVRVLCRTTRAEYYVPGVVIVLPRGHVHETRFYTLQIYNGRFVEKLRRNIVKIGPEKFKAIFKYIAELRYGGLRRSVTVESLCADREPRPHLRRKWNSSSQLRLYPDRTDRINVYRLYDKSKKEYSQQKPIHRNRRGTVDSPKPRSRPPSISSRTSSITSSIASSVVPKRTLKSGQEVLARWSDDGWYYRGVVVKGGADEKYIVRDATGYTESIFLEDILLDSDNEFQVVQPFDHVIALHPSYVFSYAPAIVKQAYHHGVTVVFYDKTQHKLPVSELYRINRTKYRKVVDYIKHCENSKAKHVAIARNDKTGVYCKCEIVCPEGVGGHNYIIKWPSEKLGQQTGNQIFMIKTGNQSQQKTNWRYALAPSDDTLSHYLPAEVIQTNPFRVKIFNQSRLTECCSHQCFWLNEAYYNNAVNFFNNIASNKTQ